ncbi:MAG: hypothetical protein JW940_06795 [Polyangiaceae bacterium]|nr:hypothetical protein [Polyangiaceae bacterium]
MLQPRRLWLSSTCTLLLWGCGSEKSGTTTEQDTIVAVSPDDFLGGVACADRPGAMRRYVATLVDVSDDLVDAGTDVKDFALPSSEPVECTHAVGFGRVVDGHRYVADIEGYEQARLEPAAPGSPVMLDTKTQELVAPRWRTRCGQVGALGVQGPVSPLKLSTVYITGCEPLVAVSRPPLAAIRIAVDQALCGDESGQVDHFSVRTRASDDVREAACEDPVVLVALNPGELVDIELSAFEADATTPRWSTGCRAVPVAGSEVQASCDPLTETTP